MHNLKESDSDNLNSAYSIAIDRDMKAAWTSFQRNIANFNRPTEAVSEAADIQLQVKARKEGGNTNGYSSFIIAPYSRSSSQAAIHSNGKARTLKHPIKQ
jgi:hypothetical protein